MLHENITVGDVHYIQNWSVADNTARDALTVAAGDVGKVCQVTGTATFYLLTDDSPMTWVSLAAGSGDVVGPGSATDNAIVRFDSTTGKLVQNSGITIADGATGTLAGSNSGDVSLNASVADILGLTGQEVTADDPGADRIVFWDDSAGKLTHLTVGSNLTITDTTISASAGASALPSTNDFRLSLTTGTPVTTSDVTTATTIYCVPYKGNSISLYDGVSAWTTVTSAEFSLAVGTLTSGLNYDVFCYNNGGTATLEFAAWTNDTTRATALVYQDGVYVKTGATTRRYMGTFRTISTTETCDTERRRFLYNWSNQVPRKLKVVESTASWNYSTASYRQANNSATNQLEVVVGVADKNCEIYVQARGFNSGATARVIAVGIGVNSTTVTSADTQANLNVTSSIGGAAVAFLRHVAVGYTYYAWLERGAGTDTQTFTGLDSGFTQSGMAGTIFC